MELEPIVEARSGKFAEVCDVDGCALSVEPHADGALGGFEDGDLATAHLVGGRIKPFPKKSHRIPSRLWLWSIQGTEYSISRVSVSHIRQRAAAQVHNSYFFWGDMVG